MEIIADEQALFCAGCRNLIDPNEPEWALVWLPYGRTPRGWLVLTVHRSEECVRMHRLQHPRQCTPDSPVLTLGEFQSAGFEVECWGDDRGFARLRNVGTKDAA